MGLRKNIFHTFPSMVDNLLLKLFVFPRGSIGRTVHLPTFTIKITHIHVGKHMMEGSYGRYLFGWSTCPMAESSSHAPPGDQASAATSSASRAFTMGARFFGDSQFSFQDRFGEFVFLSLGINRHILIS